MGGNVRLLRQAQHISRAAGWGPDFSFAVGPHPGQGTEQCALASPSWPTDQHTVGGCDAKLRVLPELLAAGQGDREFLGPEVGADVALSRGNNNQFILLGGFLCGHRGLVKGQQTVARCPPVSERLIDINDPVEGISNVVQGGVNLKQVPQGDISIEIVGGQDHERVQEGHQTIRANPVLQPLVVRHVFPPHPANPLKLAVKTMPLRLLTVVHRYGLGVVSHADQLKAEVGLHALPGEIDPHQLGPDQVGH
mmetsp:Transcript_16531/g.37948  ORF Transcript_16531/g.37948 Transcript_16531/m.37948 type:complete len:251 (+) Transcript_16531:494-1246(+)